MSPSPVFGRSGPHLRRDVLRLFPALLAVLLCGAEAQPPARPPLTNGLALEHEIRGGEVHVYPVELQEGEFLRVVVQEDGIDVAVRLVDPKGTTVLGADGLVVAHSEEDLTALAGSSGSYRIEISTSKKAAPGRYRLRVEGPRAPSEEDQIRAEAVRHTWAGFSGPNTEEGCRNQIRSLEQALPLWERLKDDRRTAEVLFGLGHKRYALAEYDQAAEDFRRSADHWASQAGRETKSWQVSALNYAGLNLKKAERLEEARRLYEKALAVARELGDDALQASSFLNLGLLETEQGEPRKGIDLGLEALRLARKAGARSTEAKSLNNLAYAYERLAEEQKALQYYQEALVLARSIPDQEARLEAEATALNNLGATHGSLGDWDKALDHYQQALKLNRAGDDRQYEAKTLNNLGVAYLRLERFDESRNSFQKALSLSQQLKDLETQTIALSNQAFLSLRVKQPTGAVEPARQALLLAKGFPEREANALYALGAAHLELGELRLAREELEQAFSLFQNREDRSSEAQLSLALARVEKKEGNLHAALSRIQSAVDTIESLRARVVNQDLRASYLASKQDYYEFLIDTLMALHDKDRTGGFAADAFQTAERARARSLLEILHEAGADIREGADRALVEREHRLREEVNARELHRLDLLAREKRDKKQIEQSEQRLEEALDEYQKVQDALRVSSPRYAALTQPQPLDVAAVRSEVLEGGALLLEYKLGTDGSFLWAVTADSIETFKLPGRDAIEKVARRYYELLTSRNQRLPNEKLPARKARIARDEAKAEQVARELSGMILRPAERQLGSQPLLIVADGALQYIPFAALPIPSSGAPLATRHEVVSLPSASALAVLRREFSSRPRAPKALAILADPVFEKEDERLVNRPLKRGRMRLDHRSKVRGEWRPEGGREAGVDLSSFRRLPFSSKEANAISAFVRPDQIFKAIGFAASRGTATSGSLAQYRNVHFATHGVLKSDRPELSGLVLSLYNQRGERQDGFLRLNDIYNLQLDADLVVLSACQTALGKEIRGEGLVGLTRGFMYAGTARVLASLWSVEDRATAELMGNFYRGMFREHLSPAAALRKAQLEMARSSSWKSPYYWAGFSLQGEWR